MKRIGNVYSKIYDMDNLRLAHKKARRKKTWYKDVRMVDANPDKYLYELQGTLINKTYSTSEYKNAIIIDKGKKRLISKLPYFPDRICQWAIMLQIEEMFLKHYIYDTYASIPGKGMHLAKRRIQKAILDDPEGTKYCLQFDIHQFFPSVNTSILKTMVRKKIKDKDLLWLLDEIIDSVESGIPIGNYLSQYLANYYLSSFDHWMKEVHKCKYYYRYMDDIVIMHGCKQHLHDLLRSICFYLNTYLELEVNPNWQVYPTTVRGIDFGGFRTFGRYVLLRKGIANNIKARYKILSKKDVIEGTDVNSIMSSAGWTQHCNCHNFESKYIYPIVAKIA